MTAGQGAAGKSNIGVEALAAAVSKAGSLEQPGATMETAAPAGGAEAAPRPVSATDAAEGGWSQQVQEGEKEHLEGKGWGGGIDITRLEASQEGTGLGRAPEGETAPAVLLATDELQPSRNLSREVEVSIVRGGRWQWW
eukprot:g16607.t1